MSLDQITNECQSRINSQISSRSTEQTTQRYDQLISCIQGHNDLYYNDTAPIISDQEYDTLFALLKYIEQTHPTIIRDDSPTQSLQSQETIQDGFTKAQHQVALLSLENSYDADDITTRHDRNLKLLYKELADPQPRYLIQPKYDGISVSLTYHDGQFVQAITRGDGRTGDDITANVRTIQNLPKTIPHTDTLILRGEIMLPKSELNRLNSQKESQGLSAFANTRNAAAGTIKLLDTQIVASRGLVCYVYDILTPDSDVSLASLGFATSDDLEKTDLTIGQVISHCLDQQLQSHLEESDIDFDGLVIKLMDDTHRHLLGSTDHHPRRAIAYKYPAQQITTTLNSVSRQVGRTGAVTPVAHLAPVELSGVTISRASLHNMDFINTKNIKLQDRLWIQRSGEVIPYVVAVAQSDDTHKQIPSPTNCPACGHLLVQEEIFIRCPDLFGCSEQIIARLTHYVSKHCMDIDGLGPSYIIQLVEQGLIHSPVDLYNLHQHVDKLLSIDGFGTKRVDKLISELERSKTTNMRRIIHAIGLPGIGKKMAQEIAKAYSTQVHDKQFTIGWSGLQTFLKDETSMIAIYGIGDKLVHDIASYIQQPAYQELLEGLQDVGIQIVPEQPQESIDGYKISGQHFSLTGSFEYGRSQIVKRLESYGAIFDSSPTKSTNIMLIGDKPGSKAAKAQKMDLTIVTSLKQLIEMFPDIKDLT